MTDPVSEAVAHYPLSHPLRVRWAEVDAQQVVFNGHYLMYADVCCTEYFRAAGVAQWTGPATSGPATPGPATSGAATPGTGEPGEENADEVLDYYVVRATLDYKASARFDDLLTLRGRISRLGNSSFTFECRIEREGVWLCTAEVTSVNAFAGASRPLPAHFRAAVSAFEAQSGPS
ncbi:acyl-CoA thioesterase [Deinococcus altitudinis]|uniref:acyl-CoA thioesterase n=1 Tax=Deinococcus altitudinis TaxID=468914 RepID=UPI003892088D